MASLVDSPAAADGGGGVPAGALDEAVSDGEGSAARRS